ncbi:hypothetical protein [Desulfocurvibacter africanus]|uniref:hypothetical protein n=1 Tax=Desulfocurvibacter africanus TaxID=873 RepID=UPI0003FE6AE2|nr:hypothetical protein [Desulfocurvibacter africanus]
MSSVINLDQFSTGKVFEIQGKRYQARPMTVEEMIQSSKDAKQMEGGGEAEQIDFILNMLEKRTDIPRDVLLKLNFPQFNKLAQEIAGS